MLAPAPPLSLPLSLLLSLSLPLSPSLSLPLTVDSGEWPATVSEDSKHRIAVEFVGVDALL